MAGPRTPKGRAREAAARLAIEYPGRVKELCALDFENPFQLLVATVLSAQTTDERVNMVTPKVFARYPTPADLGEADPDELEGLIHSTGFFRSKTQSLIGLGRVIDLQFGGEVPADMEDLVSLPGVGRKTANVVLSVGFELPGLAVDTHVTRLTRLLGLTESTDPVRIESDVDALLPPAEWGSFGLRLILHGRRVCVARRPRCALCVLADFCPSSLVPMRWTGSVLTRADKTLQRPGPAAGEEKRPAAAPRRPSAVLSRAGLTTGGRGARFASPSSRAGPADLPAGRTEVRLPAESAVPLTRQPGGPG